MDFRCSFFGRQQGETVGQVEAHLVSEYAFRARSRAVGLLYALSEDAVEQFKILFHT